MTVSKEWAPPAASRRDIQWIEGLRGIAACLVMSSHLFRSFSFFLIYPALSQNGPIAFMQHPLIRLPIQSHCWVALFFVLSGLVNALGFVRAAQNSNFQYALNSLARSSFRRVGRLVLPCVVATVFSCFICQFGGYELARTYCNGWILDTIPDRMPTVWTTLYALGQNLLATWTFEVNSYDKIQWTMPHLLSGSLMVSLAMLVTLFARPKYWPWLIFGLYSYFWIRHDATTGLNTFAGVFLAKLVINYSPSKSGRSLLSTVLPFFPIFLGLYFVSFPEFGRDFAPWSYNLNQFGIAIFPRGCNIWMFWNSIGIHFLMIGIVFSRVAQQVLSLPVMVRLGELSYAIYLLHGPLLRSLLIWLLYGLRMPPHTHENGNPRVIFPLPGSFRFYLSIAIYLMVVFGLSKLWSMYVERWCAKATSWLEERIFLTEQDVMDIPRV